MIVIKYYPDQNVVTCISDYTEIRRLSSWFDQAGMGNKEI